MPETRTSRDRYVPTSSRVFVETDRELLGRDGVAAPHPVGIRGSFVGKCRYLTYISVIQYGTKFHRRSSCSCSLFTFGTYGPADDISSQSIRASLRFDTPNADAEDLSRISPCTVRS
jgi:hypothetical protein